MWSRRCFPAGDNAVVASTRGGAEEPARRLDVRVGHVHDWLNGGEGLTVKLLVDGQDVLADAGPPGWFRGPWPPVFLASDSPLFPASPPRRVLLYFTGTPDPDEPNVTAVITADGRQVTWSDLRVCRADAEIDADGWCFELEPERSTPLAIPDLVFDREQYLAEVRRAVTDREWESDRWRTALLLEEYLGAAISAQPGATTAGYTPYDAEPADDDSDDYLVTMWNDRGRSALGIVVAVTAGPGTPEQRARAMTQTLLATPIQAWRIVQRMHQQC